jgi:tRNA pseudouridine55 synthase
MIFAVYKPKGITSNGALNTLRHAAKTKKIGHAGTLDPLAEGVLVVGVGRESTKHLADVVAKEKEYVATIRLGITSITDDEEGEKTERTGYRIPSIKHITNILPVCTGSMLQKPPLYSAIKVRGKEAYKRARAGESIYLKERPILIKQITVEEYKWPFLKLRVVTGPGVYIRALARDLGEELGTGGYLASLIRTRVGHWNVANALPLEKALQKVVL